MLVDEAMHRNPSRNGMLLICIARFRPKYSANIPDKTDPTGFVITPKLAATIKYLSKEGEKWFYRYTSVL